MIITVNPTFDIETGRLLYHDGQYEYTGPVEEFKKPKPSPVIQKGQDISQQDRQQQQQQYGQAGQQLGTAQDTLGAAQGTLGQFEGPVNQSPFYKALLNAGTQGTSEAYQNATAATRANANRAGFGYQQPVEQGAESQIQAKEASDMANLPQKAMVQATGPALEAARESTGIGQAETGIAGTEAGMGTALGQQGEQYFGSTIPLEQQYQNQLAQRSQGLWNAISGIASPLTGGLSNMLLGGFGKLFNTGSQDQPTPEPYGPFQG